MIITEELLASWTDAKTFGKAKKALDTCHFTLYHLGYVTSSSFVGSGVELAGYVTLMDERESCYCSVILTLEGPKNIQCDGYYCRSNKKKLCYHNVIMILLMLSDLENYPISVSTPYVGRVLEASAMTQEDENLHRVHLEPVLTQEGHQFKVRFKIGSQKMYFIKDVEAFIHYFDFQDTIKYGKDLIFTHRVSDIYEEDLPLFYLISKYVGDLEVYKRRDESYYLSDVALNKQLLLSGSFLDDFFDIYESKSLEMKIEKQKHMVSFINGNPDISLQLKEKKVGQYTGIEMPLPDFCYLDGCHYKYLFDDDVLYRLDDYFSQQIYPLFKRLSGLSNQVVMDETDMKQFMATAYPLLAENVHIEAENFELSDYTPPKAEFNFYFDYDGQSIILNPEVTYEGKTYYLGIENIPHYHDQMMENRVIGLINRNFSI